MNICHPLTILSYYNTIISKKSAEITRGIENADEMRRKTPTAFPKLRTTHSLTNTSSRKGRTWRFTAVIFQNRRPNTRRWSRGKSACDIKRAESGKDANSRCDESRKREWLHRMSRRVRRTIVKPEDLSRRSYTLRRNEKDKGLDEKMIEKPCIALQTGDLGGWKKLREISTRARERSRLEKSVLKHTKEKKAPSQRGGRSFPVSRAKIFALKWGKKCEEIAYYFIYLTGVRSRILSSKCILCVSESNGRVYAKGKIRRSARIKVVDVWMKNMDQRPPSKLRTGNKSARRKI